MRVFNLFVSSVCFCLVGGIFAIEDYCNVHTYNSNDSFMQFTKEPSVEEFAIVGNFKGLHCCSKGYRSIEWYKNDRPYPWAGSVSQLILYPESKNQTVYTQSVTVDDAGNYTCILKNDTITRAHTIQLRVYDKVPDDPKITYMSHNTEAVLGQSVRLFCEAFVGRVDLPDVHNEAHWRKVALNSTLDETRIRQEKVSRENNQITGTYLVIENINKDDYGKYVCSISKPGKSIDLYVYVTERMEVEYLRPNPFPMKEMLLCMSGIVLILLTVVVLNKRYGLLLRVKFKDNFGTLECDDGKANDVLIVYSPKDAEIVTGVLIPVLESKYYYKCGSRELSSNISNWHTELAEVSKRSRRILAVISPSCLEEKWDSKTLFHAIKELRSLGSLLSCIILKPLPDYSAEVKDTQGESLATLLRSICVIHWERSQDDRFWLTLRLGLPPKRNCQNTTENVTQGDNCKRLKTQDSFDNLV